MKKVSIAFIIALLSLIGYEIYVQTHMLENENNIATQQKADLILVDAPKPHDTISNPIVITGKARGPWFFEASFPITLTDVNGNVLAQGAAHATSDWMTTDFVPFEATLTIDPAKTSYSGKATLTLSKDNPSGLPENDDSLTIPVVISGATF